MREKKSVENLAKQDLTLLYDLYRYRALSTAQIVQIRGLGKWYVYKKLSYLREKGYLYSEQISGNYIPNQKRQGSYHRISGKGITLLKEHGYLIDSTADDLKIAKFRLPYLLTTNDLAIPLTKNGWSYNDSRSVKSFHELNRGDILQGTLSNPDQSKEYALYIFLQKVQEDTLTRIKHEINRNPFEDILVITRGEPSFDSVIKSFTDRANNRKNMLIKGGSIKVLPFLFAKAYLNISNDREENHKHFLSKLGIEILNKHSSKSSFESNVNFDYLIRYNEEEMYFVDLLDNDLMKIQEIRHYRKESYKYDGRKVLALTSAIPAHHSFHKQMLGDMTHIDFLTLNPREVVDFATELSNKNVFE